MKRYLKKLPILGLAFLLVLNACSTSKNQNPVSGEEVGKVSEASYSGGEEKPATYTAREGDTLRKIAGRPEIYGDPNLWPILAEANAEVVGHGTRVNKGVQLTIPRDISTEQIEMAHEKARQAAAEDKMSSRPAKKAEAVPTAAPVAEATPVNTPVPPLPVPQAKKSGVLLPVLFVLLLILAALAVVLFYFMKKEKKDESQD